MVKSAPSLLKFVINDVLKIWRKRFTIFKVTAYTNIGVDQEFDYVKGVEVSTGMVS